MGTSIPDKIAENTEITPAGKLVFSPMFDSVKKGQIATVSLAGLGRSIGLVKDGEVVAGIRSLQEHSYALVDEQYGLLEDILREQEVMVTATLVLRVMPILPQDEESVDRRRYSPEEGMPALDIVQVGRMVYTAHVSKMMDLWSLSIRARVGDTLGQTVLVDNAIHDSARKAWDWFDTWIESVRELHGKGEALPGASGENARDEAIIAALGHLGYDRPSAEKAAAAHTEEMDDLERVKRCIKTLGGDVRKDVLKAKAFMEGGRG